MLHRIIYILFFATFSLVLFACSGESETGPVEVKWDQNNCERCRMMLSDRNFAAQIRYFPEAKRSRVVKFDDIGCAVLWIKDQQWNNDPKTQIWVADHSSGEWIDARKATYIRKNNSPMGYDLGAQAEADPDGLNFDQAILRIEEVEKKFNSHGMHHQHMQQQDLKQQGMARESAK
ncbi:MAG: nitrous oxide reductase accessory protein NosL [Gammaproteobacteria bacterium]|nr:nitrous oxide reductase accessory protein NosL [Gammaproteobacteria bacterium]